MSLKVKQASGQLLHEAFVSLRSLGKRSVLALSGIVIGSSSVIALINIGHNAADDASAIFKALGTDTIVIYVPANDAAHRSTLTSKDIVRLQEGVPTVMRIAAISTSSSSVVVGGRSESAMLVGTTPALSDTLRMTMREGRFLSRFDSLETFAVVGDTLAQALGTPEKPLQVGEKIRIGHYQFVVIGITQQQSPSMLISVSVNDSIFIPLEGMRRIVASPWVSQVVAQAVPEADVSDVAAHLVTELKVLMGISEFNAQLAQQFIDAMAHQNRTFTYLLMGLGLISLIGGGVGVMNVMLMNVSERRREIGIRVALGARRKDIRNLFLLEAVTLTALGALGGAVLGVGAAYGYAAFSGWQFSLASISLPLGVGSTLLTGLFFGLYPAISASRLLPVQALRDE